MKDFLLKTFVALALYTTPILILYIWWNPFAALPWSYPFPGIGSPLPVNRGYISTLAYTEGRKMKPYDSFIFGNSQAMSMNIDRWASALGCRGSAMHFDASEETIEGLYLKLKLIRENNDTIRNALVGLYADIAQNPKSGIPFIIPANLYGKSEIRFQYYCFSQFLRWPIFREVVRYNLSGQYNPPEEWMRNTFALFPPDSIDIRANHFYYSYANHYFNKYPEEGRSPTADTPFITDCSVFSKHQVFMLREIEKWLSGSNYMFVIFPRADKLVLSAENKELLEGIFGEHFLDLSRFPNAYTGKMTFYDKVHFTTALGEQLLDSIITAQRNF